MKTEHKRMVTSKEDFFAFYNELSDNPEYHGTKEDMLKWLEVCDIKFPAKYPCLARFSIRRISVDDVGMGFEDIYTIHYTYKDTIEQAIEMLQKQLAQFP